MVKWIDRRSINKKMHIMCKSSSNRQEIMIVCIVRIGNQFRNRNIEDDLLRKSGHGLSDSGSTRDFKYWEAISLALRLNRVYIPGVEIDLDLPRWYYLQKTCIVPAPVSSSVAQ